MVVRLIVMVFSPQLVRINVADLLPVRMTISGENSYLGHIFQDVG